MAKIISKNKTVVLIYSAKEFQEMVSRLARETPNLSQRRLARILGFSDKVISDCRLDKYPHK